LPVDATESSPPFHSSETMKFAYSERKTLFVVRLPLNGKLGPVTVAGLMGPVGSLG
jgi:hypothetical protein